MQQSDLNVIDLNIPLIIDLDGTLIKTDSLHEGLITSLLKSPISIFRLVPALFKGKSFFKHIVTDIVEMSADVFCYRNSLLSLIENEKKKGRKILLVTAANQKIADNVQAHLQLFDKVQGSDSTLNLKGKNKLNWLKENFPAGFVYAGDHKADLPIWRESKAAVIVGQGKSQLKEVKKFSIPYLVVEDEAFNKAREWFKQLRVHQWAKNLLVFVPLLLAHMATDLHALILTFIAFIAFSLVASATYIINDLCDIESDRRHRTKRYRPIAAGTISTLEATIGCLLLFLLGGVILAAISWLTFLCVTIYVAITIAYSFKLKRIPLLDVAIIGTLFTIRVIIGSTVNELPLSPWLNSFSALFFFSLALSKRHVEVMRMPAAGKEVIGGRGYIHADWPLTLSLGVASSISSVVIMLLFLTQEAMINAKYTSPNWLLIEPACVFLWILRIWLLSHRKKLNDDPVIFAVKDRTSLFLAIVVLISFIFATY